MAHKKILKSEASLGNVSNIGEGFTVIEGEDISTNIMGSIPTESLDTFGIGNLDYKKNKKLIEQTQPIDENGQPIDISIDVSLEKTNKGILIKGEGIEKRHVIEALKKPTVLRTPRILLLHDGISKNEAENVIIQSNNTIKSNNIKKGRADTLNIIAMPSNEYIRQAIIGNIEKNIFGTFGKKGKSNTNIIENEKDLREYKKLLNESKTKDFKLKSLEEQNKLQIKIQNALEVIKKSKLPKSMKLEHPYKKIIGNDNKIRKRMINVSNIEFDTLYDNTNIKNPEESSYNDDFRKIFVKKGIASIEITEDEYNVLNNSSDLQLQNSVYKDEENIYWKKFDIGKVYEFKDKNVANTIIQFQPDLTDQRKPPYFESKWKGTSTARIGIESRTNPQLSTKLNDIIYNTPELQTFLEKNPKQEIKFKAFLEQLDAHEKSLDVIPQLKCGAGSIPVLRKWSPNSWAMTKKQKICDGDLVFKRNELLQNRSLIEKENIIKENIANKQKTISHDELEFLALQKANDYLNETNVEYRKVVGCNTKEEVNKVNAIEISNQMKIEESMETGEKLESLDVYKVPMRYPTPYAMGDVLYCKSHDNIIPNIKYTFDVNIAKAWQEGKSIPKDDEDNSEKEAMFGSSNKKSKVKKLDDAYIHLRESSRSKDKKIIILKEDINELIDI
ncbi:MAG: hypothetical protein WC934_06875 [Acidithiobacillus sp.]|jgi:hypothetical protein|uniref:hypothetical protein n=1 Tax=Acidithiobacillus sp. TaxID=1872118 RepID=UPI003560A218